MVKITLVLFFCSLQLSALSQSNIFDAAKSGNNEILVELLKEYPDTVNAINQNGHTALILASYHNRLETAKLLIEAGADIEYSFSQGSAIHGAAYKGYPEITQLLIDNGIALDVPDQNGSTPLIYATLFNHTEVAAILTKHGANPNHKDNTGSSAFDYAKALKHTELLSLFESTHK